MNKFLLILILSLAAQSNELVFKDIKQASDGSINVLFGLEKVSYINSYTLENPTRLVFDINQAKAALHSSLRKLKVDTIDIYMLHDCNRYDVESDELLDFLNTSKAEGKIRAFGLATEIDSIVKIEQSKSAFSQVLQCLSGTYH